MKENLVQQKPAPDSALCDHPLADGVQPECPQPCECKTEKYRGWATLDDGTHVPLTEADAKALMSAVRANETRQALAMPSTHEAVSVMFDAFDRLRRLGWSRGSYCPKDGSMFAAIQHGSTGIFTGFYSGEWPDGYAHIEDEIAHPDGFLWKALGKLTEWEEQARLRSAQRTSNHIDRLVMSAQDQVIAPTDTTKDLG